MWTAIPSSKVVVEAGHVLRAHHDFFQRLQIPGAAVRDGGRQISGGAVALRIRQLIRSDDQISLSSEGLTVIFRGDVAAAEALFARLAREIRELKASHVILPPMD